MSDTKVNLQSNSQTIYPLPGFPESLKEPVDFWDTLQRFVSGANPHFLNTNGSVIFMPIYFGDAVCKYQRDVLVLAHQRKNVMGECMPLTYQDIRIVENYRNELVIFHPSLHYPPNILDLKLQFGNG